MKKTIRALAIAALIGGAAMISAGDASAWGGNNWNPMNNKVGVTTITAMAGTMATT